MESETLEPVKDLNELQNADWVRGIFTLVRYDDIRCVYVITRWQQLMLFLLSPGTILGASDARSANWSKVKEGSGAPVQSTAHRIPAHSL